MKKILIFLLCVIFVCAMPLVAFAEDSITDTVGTNDVVTESLPVEVEDVTEGVNSGVEAPDTEVVKPDDVAPEKSEIQIEAEAITEKIVQYVKDHFEEISVIITMILTVYYQVVKHKALNTSVRTLNNNSISVVENSTKTINDALFAVQAVSESVVEYKVEIKKLLEEVRANEEEKQKLATALTEVEAYLKSAKLANVELSNEVAELLVLANIPNSKKEELYSRHRAAVDAIAAAEITAKNAEVNEDDRQEA